MSATITNKITPSLRRAVMEASPHGRMAILAPIFEGEDAVAEVLEVLQSSKSKKFGYKLHHVGTLVFDAADRKFRWEYQEGYYTRFRGRGGGGYFTVTGEVHKESTCVPIMKTEDIGDRLPSDDEIAMMEYNDDGYMEELYREQEELYREREGQK